MHSIVFEQQFQALMDQFPKKNTKEHPMKLPEIEKDRESTINDLVDRPGPILL